MTITNAVQTYLTQCTNVKKLEPLTLKAYKTDLRQFQEFMADKAENISELDKVLVGSYIDYISPQYRAKSLKRKAASLKAFFNFLEFEDIIVVTPFRKIKLHIKEGKKIPKALTLFDMEKVLSYLYNHKSKQTSQKRNVALIELLFDTGIRISELCNIRLTDIQIEAQTLSIRGKGNKERVVFLSNKYTLSALKNYLVVRYMYAGEKNSPYLFINRIGNKYSTESARLAILSLGRKALGKHVTPHMFRHTFATLLLEEGVDITYIKSFLGHSSISTTQIYAASTTYRQRQILTTLHPRNRIRTVIPEEIAE